MVSTGKFFATWLITLPLWAGTWPRGHFLPTVTWLLTCFRTRSTFTCMARLLTVVVSTRQLPPARLTTGPLLGTTAYHPGFLFTTVAGHGHGLRTGGTGSWMTQEQTGVSTFRLQVSATCLPTGVGHKPRVKLWVCFFSTKADVFCRTVFLLVLCSTFRTVPRNVLARGLPIWRFVGMLVYTFTYPLLDTLHVEHSITTSTIPDSISLLDGFYTDQTS